MKKNIMMLFLMVFSFVGIQASGVYVPSESDSEDEAIIRRPSKLCGVEKFSLLAPELSKVNICPIDLGEISEGSDAEMAASFMELLSTKVVPGKAMDAYLKYRDYLNNRGPDCLVGEEEDVTIEFVAS